MWKYADYLAGYEQQDAHEFLIALLGGLQAHIDSYHTPLAQPNIENGHQRHQTHDNTNIVVVDNKNRMDQKKRGLVDQVNIDC